MCIYWEVEYDDDGKREIIPEDELLNMEEYYEEVFGYYTWKLIGQRTLSEYLDSISNGNAVVLRLHGTFRIYPKEGI